MTEKQYDTDPSKNEGLKAIDAASKHLERVLLQGSAKVAEAAALAAEKQRTAVTELDRVLLEASQKGVKFEDIERALPVDGSVLTTRLEKVFALVDLDSAFKTA